MGSVPECVNDGSLRAGHRKPLYLAGLLACGIVAREVELDPNSSSLAPFRAGEGQMNRAGDRIREIEQIKGSLMRHHRAGIAEGKPGDHHVLVRTGGKMA
jgi:hypothetical protein